MNTDGACHSVRIMSWVSVLSSLILEKKYDLFFFGANKTACYNTYGCPYKWVSIEWGSTIPFLPGDHLLYSHDLYV